jgi:hypothetical protein
LSRRVKFPRNEPNKVTQEKKSQTQKQYMENNRGMGHFEYINNKVYVKHSIISEDVQFYGQS